MSSADRSRTVSVSAEAEGRPPRTIVALLQVHSAVSSRHFPPSSCLESVCEGPLAKAVEDLPNLIDLASHRVSPHAEHFVSIHSGHPALGGGRLYFGKIVEALGFENEMGRRIGLEPDDEIRDVIVRLAVVQIRNGETK